MLYTLRTRGITVPFQDALIAYTARKYKAAVWAQALWTTEGGENSPPFYIVQKQGNTRGTAQPRAFFCSAYSFPAYRGV